MSTEGFAGFYFETRSYADTAALWQALGFTNVFETDHGSGQWVHPSGGPYVFIAEHSDPDHELDTHPILSVADATSFEPDHELEYARPFEPQHWGFVEALIKDADGRLVSLQAPVPDGEDAPDMDAHHKQKYG